MEGDDDGGGRKIRVVVKDGTPGDRKNRIQHDIRSIDTNIHVNLNLK